MQPTSDTPTIVRKGLRILVMVLATVALFLLTPPLLRWFNPEAGSFDTGTLNAPILAALQFAAAVGMAFVPWRYLFAGFYAYVRDSMEEKLLANITDKLSTDLLAGGDIAVAVERRHIAQLQFTIRCVRLIFCLLPFAIFLVLAMHFLNTALTIVPR